MTAPETNRLLEALTRASRERLLRAAKQVHLPLRATLFEVGEPPEYAYFLTSGIASIVVELAGGGTAEVAMTGREGLVGDLQLLGPAASPTRCFIQMEANAYRLPFSQLRRLFLDSEEIRERILQTVQQHSMTMSQLTACNKLHATEQRLARWLLMVRDRVQQETLLITQEFLAQMLGTQRTTVVAAARSFQRKGMIAYSRGRVTILSVPQLEQAACDCYKITRQLLLELYSG